MYCNNCKREVKSGQFCPKCGNLLSDPNAWFEEDGFSVDKKDKKNSQNTVLLIAGAIIILVIMIAVLLMFVVKPSGSKDMNEDASSNVVVDEEDDGSDEQEDGNKEEEKSARMVEVPDIEGMPVEDATSILTECKLSCNIEYRESDNIDAGYVISQYPKAGKSVEEKETVILYVSNTEKKDAGATAAPTEAAQAATPTTTPATTPEAAQVETVVTLYCCASDFATLRSGASRSSSSLAKIPSRDSMTYIAEVGEFYNVEYKGQNGYVLKDFVSFDANAPLNYGSGSSSSSASSTDGAATILYCCASDFATLRGSASREGADYGKIYSRESVELLDSTGEWYYVNRNGQQGYVLKAYFSTDPNAPLNYGDR